MQKFGGNWSWCLRNEREDKNSSEEVDLQDWAGSWKGGAGSSKGKADRRDKIDHETSAGSWRCWKVINNAEEIRFKNKQNEVVRRVDQYVSGKGIFSFM